MIPEVPSFDCIGVPKVVECSLLMGRIPLHHRNGAIVLAMFLLVLRVAVLVVLMEVLVVVPLSCC